MADVICPNCGERYHQTTDAYLPGVTTTGDMLKLKPLYALNGWSSFPEHEGMMHGALECPGCGGCYSSDGQVRIDMDQWESEQDVVLSAEKQRLDSISEFQDSVTNTLKQSRNCVDVTAEPVGEASDTLTFRYKATVIDNGREAYGFKVEKKKPGRPKKI